MSRIELILFLTAADVTCIVAGAKKEMNQSRSYEASRKAEESSFSEQTSYVFSLTASQFHVSTSRTSSLYFSLE
jgi:hypothetical protein